MTDAPHIPVSWGELLDKITILEIKRARIGGPARVNVIRELDALLAIANGVIARDDLAPLVAALRAVNAALWEIENAIREEDAAGRFGAEFVRLARAVYTRNDERAGVKRAISLALGSMLVEEKSYKGFNSEGLATA